MKRIVTWKYSPLIGIAGKAFVERWIELFHNLTIDNFRVKHLNVRIGFEELRAVIKESENKSIEASNIKDVSAELLQLLKIDPIAKTLLPHHEHYYLSLADPYIKEHAKTVHPGLKVLVDQACDALGRKYRFAIIDRLKCSINNDDVENTIQLTSLLASDLIYSGYDSRHLLEKGMAFVQKPEIPFNKRLDDILDHLRSNSVQQFAVAYRIDFANEKDASQCPQCIGTVQIISDVNADYCLRAHIPGQNVRLAKLELQALDRFAASRSGLTEFHRSLDILQFARPSLQIVSHSLAYVISETDQVRTVKTSLELLGPIRIAKEEVEGRLSQLTKISDRVDHASCRRLLIGLQYLRRGLTESAPQGQFLNYWIGLEAIAGGKHRTTIATIRQTVSRMMALGYPRRLVRDLEENFQRLGIALNPLMTQGRDITGQLARLESLWQSVCDESKLQQLVALASTSPLLQSRIRTTANLLGTAGKTNEAVLGHQQDIDWHMQRLYRVRNGIVHGGEVPSDLTHLASHLATYLWVMLRSILDDFASEGGSQDIGKYFDKHLKIYEMVLAGGKKPKEHAPFSIWLEPVSLWPQV